MAKYIMALDAGTTSNRCILFNEKGEMCSVAQKEFTQFFPKPGWVEHDAEEIWATQLEVAKEAMANIQATAADICAIGITNQRDHDCVGQKYGRAGLSRDSMAVQAHGRVCGFTEGEGAYRDLQKKDRACDRCLFFGN